MDEQQFIVHVVNYLQQHNAWANTAMVLAYDDSDGWYDHAVPPIVNGSGTPSDTLNGVNLCGTGVPALAGPNAATPFHSGLTGAGELRAMAACLTEVEIFRPASAILKSIPGCRFCCGIMCG